MTSFEELYEKYATDVLRVSYFYLGDRQRAEDAPAPYSKSIDRSNRQ